LIEKKAPVACKRQLPPKEIGSYSKFINVFSEIAIPEANLLLQHSAIGRAMDFLNFSAETPLSEYSDQPLPEKEIERLMCIVYISFACTHSQYTQSDLELLNEFLETTEHVWLGSTSTLHWLLTQSVGKGPAGLKDDQRTRRLVKIARPLAFTSYSSLEKRYLDALIQEPNGGVSLLSPN
jgi:hypothetical protein